MLLPADSLYCSVRFTFLSAMSLPTLRAAIAAAVPIATAVDPVSSAPDC